jgi:hypothetical protein
MRMYEGKSIHPDSGNKNFFFLYLEKVAGDSPVPGELGGLHEVSRRTRGGTHGDLTRSHRRERAQPQAELQGA